MMVASSADTIQMGLSGLFEPIIKEILSLGGVSPDKPGYNSLKLAINVSWTVVINVIAIVLATKKYSVLSLFVLADLLCATCVVPILMGLSEKVHPAAALVGCFTGLGTALLVYGVGLPHEEGNFFWVLEAGGLYKDTALVAFLLTPACSGIATLLVSIPFYIKGYRHAGYPGELDQKKDPSSLGATDLRASAQSSLGATDVSMYSSTAAA